MEILQFVLILTVAKLAVAENRILSVTQCNEECTTDGIICSDASTVAYCVPTGGLWQKVTIDICDTEAGHYCNKREGGCSPIVGSCHPGNQEGVFACTSQGVFPNPFDCRVYHMCYTNGGNIVSIDIQCQNSAFSVTTNQCSLSLDSEVCRVQQWSCERAGEVRAWPGTNNLYYICVNSQGTLSPLQFRCDPNQIFLEGRCVEDTSVGTTEASTGFQCQSPGLHPDPNDCQSYYYCDLSFNSQHHQCPAGTIFEAVTLSCVRGSC